MNISKSMKDLTILIVLGILVHWSYLSDNSHATQALKDPAANQSNTIQPAGTMNTKPTADSTQRLVIEGRVMCERRGMKQVEMILTESLDKGRMGINRKGTTDNNGNFRFVVQLEDAKTKYKLVPKHPDFSPGDNFYPREKEFSSKPGNMKIDFAYNGPLPDLVYITTHSYNSIMIKNQGGLDAGNFSVSGKFDIECSEVPTRTFGFSINGIRSGHVQVVDLRDWTKCTTITKSYDSLHIPSTTVTTTPRPIKGFREIKVDLNDSILESNENNNNILNNQPSF